MKAQMSKLILAAALMSLVSACSPDVSFKNASSTLAISKLDDNQDGQLSDQEIQDDDQPVVDDDQDQDEQLTDNDGDDDQVVDEPGLADDSGDGENLDNDMEGNIDDHFACGNEDEKKVLVCKVPPGNESNEHSICISKNALQSQLQTGSYLGKCKSESSDDEGSDDTQDGSKDCKKKGPNKSGQH